MSPVQVLSSPQHDCKKDGHLIALRCRWDLDNVQITPFCTFCDRIMLPGSSVCDTTGFWTKFLMGIVESAAFAPDAPPEAYEGMYD